MLRILLSFFAGAVAMLLFLAPGELRLSNLCDRDKTARITDFDQAARRIEHAHDLALFYACQAREAIGQTIHK